MSKIKELRCVGWIANKEKIRIFQFLKVEVLFISQFGKMAEITSVESGVELQNEIKILMIRFYL